MSNGLRGARKLSEADTEQTAMDNTNKETISNMDAAITGIQDWQKQREEQMLKFKRELLANEKEINSNVSPTIVKENEDEGKNCSNNDDNNNNNNNNNNEDHETNFEQSIFMTDDVTYSVKNLNISSSKSNNSLTSYLKDENEDPIALAVENKLKQELKQLQEKRKIQLKNFGPENNEKEFSAKDADACIRRNMAKYGLSPTQLKELTSNDSKSAQDLALIQQQVRILRSNTYASSIAAKCRLEIDEAEVEKEAEKNGLEDVNKIQQDLDSYNFELEEALLKLKALDK
tara:strand:- start:979 stop:1842 length:864 start_codon:yes stop_codon:yes gene_type:complete